MRSVYVPVLIVSLYASAAMSQGTLLNYQGKLSDTNGVPYNGVIDTVINVYSQSTGGSPVYSENVGNLVVQEGLYSFNWGVDGISWIQSSEEVAVADGTSNTFGFNVASTPVESGSVTITGGSYSWRDDGSGSSSPADFLGTVIDYNTGQMSAIFLSGNPSNGTVVRVEYITPAVGYSPSGSEEYIEVILNGEALSPRARVTAVPIALFALNTNESDPVWNAEKGNYATGTPIYVESDPVWNAEKGNYATGTPIYVESDPVWNAEKGNYATGTPIYVESDPVWNAEKGNYATGTPIYVESDPVWNAEKGNYATGTPIYVESDPVWNAEKGNYATGTPIYVESDPVWNAEKGNYAQLDGDGTLTVASNLVINSGGIQFADGSIATTSQEGKIYTKLVDHWVRTDNFRTYRHGWVITGIGSWNLWSGLDLPEGAEIVGMEVLFEDASANGNARVNLVQASATSGSGVSNVAVFGFDSGTSFNSGFKHESSVFPSPIVVVDGGVWLNYILVKNSSPPLVGVHWVKIMYKL